MLTEIEPWQFEEWIIAMRLGLDPHAWRQAGETAAVIHNQMTLLRNQLGKRDTELNELVTFDHFLPPGMVDREAISKRQEQMDNDSILRTEPK